MAIMIQLQLSRIVTDKLFNMIPDSGLMNFIIISYGQYGKYKWNKVTYLFQDYLQHLKKLNNILNDGVL